ncbi:basic amino acid/polyamine antiporter [Paenibacillus sp. UNC499MF]|uniref:basic amino acid/polyamine antiporter n=1 Tax=Paenibacillus sp. UNC499MF TaxID=1502751 RepID=UPI0008A096A7|nr:basic amino acid/polyamine antiporter [Paenibacillus sp. UNC499MF]SEG55791.1 arginine:ornithine antiporter / lysine permease [Paenibacillus sp. UNC499MF]
MSNEPRKLGLLPLISLVVGSMIGGGIFSMPADMAQDAGSGAALIGWALTGVGVIMLALTFQSLANRLPSLDNGIVRYAETGFGRFVGFISAWGYWLANMITIVASSVLLFGALDYFIPVFDGGNNVLAIVCASLLVWLLHSLQLSGIREATLVHIVTTMAKLIPILVFIAALATVFHSPTFIADLWKTAAEAAGSPIRFTDIGSQVKQAMFITVWAFLGVEGAVVLSGRAKRKSDVGKATVIGLIGTLVLYMLVSLLSYGAMSRAALASLPTPSAAYVLEAAVGKWGAVLINAGLIVSLLGLLLGMSLLSAETLYVAGKQKLMPAWLSGENKNGAPKGALWMTTGSVQLFLILVVTASSTYHALYLVATTAALMPYLLSSLFLVKTAIGGKAYATQNSPGESPLWSGPRKRELAYGAAATLYSLFLLYAAGLTNLLYVCMLYTLGLAFYSFSGREKGIRAMYEPAEAFAASAIIVLGLYSAIQFISGHAG